VCECHGPSDNAVIDKVCVTTLNWLLRLCKGHNVFSRLVNYVKTNSKATNMVVRVRPKVKGGDQVFLSCQRRETSRGVLWWRWPESALTLEPFRHWLWLRIRNCAAGFAPSWLQTALGRKENVPFLVWPHRSTWYLRNCRLPRQWDAIVIDCRRS
jgi:hypothetical protein